MKSLFIFLFFFIVGCGSFSSRTPKSGRTEFSYTDISGTYRIIRENKKVQEKVITRNTLKEISSRQKTLEKSITVSQLGSIQLKGKRIVTLRPFASDFNVWLEGKKYSSKMRINPKSKTMDIKLSSPEKKWSGQQRIKFPKGEQFCFYSQLSTCLYYNGFLERAQENNRKRFPFMIVWDSWPYLQEMLSGVGKNLFANAVLKYDGEHKGDLRYIVEVEGQIILYHFSKSFDLVKIAWIAQGITMVPPGEEVPSEGQ